MSHRHAVSGHWSEPFAEEPFQRWVERLRQSLPAARVSLGLLFIHPRHAERARQILEIVQVHGQVPLLVGCSGVGLICGGEEVESGAGIALALYDLPGAALTGFHFTQQDLEDVARAASAAEGWFGHTGLRPKALHGWLAFADPFSLDCDTWLHTWNEAYAPLPVVGGLASGDSAARSTQVFLNSHVYDEGVVVVGLGGSVGLECVLSQGCTPIGETWTITKTDQNLILEIGNRPAYSVLAETFAQLPEEEKRKTQGNILVGLVINEYLEEFRRGDFLIRTLLGGDPATGVLAVGALPRPGQTMQFQRRDAAAANEDMVELLTRAHERLGGSSVLGGCLCSCNGRGEGLFGYPHHDAALVQRRFGPLGVAGFFCNGEIGPVGDKNFLHGFTASLALFVQREPR